MRNVRRLAYPTLGFVLPIFVVLALLHGTRAPVSAQAVDPRNRGCQDGWEIGWDWNFYGRLMGGGIPHKGVYYYVSSALKIQGSDFLRPYKKMGGALWWHAKYKFSPDPAPSVSNYQDTYGKYQYLWHDPEAIMVCEWSSTSSNVFFLFPVETDGGDVEVHYIQEDKCDDPTMPGCEGGDGGGSTPPPANPPGDSGGPPQSGLHYRCVIYYEYSEDTGEIIYWTVLGCYEVDN